MSVTLLLSRKDLQSFNVRPGVGSTTTAQREARFMGTGLIPATPEMYRRPVPPVNQGERGFRKDLRWDRPVDMQAGARTPPVSKLIVKGLSGSGYYRREWLSPNVLPGHKPMAGLGEIPEKGDTRGYKTRDFLSVQHGAPYANSDYGEVCFVHGGDKFTMGSNKYPTTFRAYIRHIKHDKDFWGNPTTEHTDARWEEYDLKAGEFKTLNNGESDGRFDNVDIWVTLTAVGQTDAEKATVERDRDSASKAISDAEAIFSALKQANVDTSSLEGSLADARASFDKGDFATARRTAQQVLASAQNLKTVQDLTDIQRKKQAILNDASLTADQKAALIAELDKQSANISGSDWGAWVRENQTTVAVVAGGAVALTAIALILRAWGGGSR